MFGRLGAGYRTRNRKERLIDCRDEMWALNHAAMRTIDCILR